MTNRELRLAVRNFRGPIFLITPTIDDVVFIELTWEQAAKVFDAQPPGEPAIWNIQEATSDGMYLSKDPAP